MACIPAACRYESIARWLGGGAGGVSVERGGGGGGAGGTYSSSFWRSERAGIVLVEEKNASRVL